jgi:hypothetical protein
VTVDYSLLQRFEESSARHQAARDLLPAHWRSDTRPEAQLINDLWVSVIVRAHKHLEYVASSRPTDE